MNLQVLLMQVHFFQEGLSARDGQFVYLVRHIPVSAMLLFEVIVTLAFWVTRLSRLGERVLVYRA